MGLSRTYNDTYCTTSTVWYELMDAISIEEGAKIIGGLHLKHVGGGWTTRHTACMVISRDGYFTNGRLD